MKTKPVLLLAMTAFLLGVSLACSFSSAAPAPTLAPAATETQAQSKFTISISNQGINFTIPNSLVVSGASDERTSEVELPFTNPGNGDMPEHVKDTLKGYPLTGRTAYIAIFPAEAYAQYSEQTADVVAALKTLPETVDPLNSPLLQYSFYAQAKVLSFQNGRGLRYLTQVMQAVMPIDNAEMFYWFTGLTSDGKYYISAVFPVSSSLLQADSNLDATVPAGGVPFQDTFDAAQATQYYDQVQQKLNGADPGSFAPDLATLDALIQSLNVVAP